MSSGPSQQNYPAQVVAGESAGSNQAFQPFPYPNTTQAANNAFSGIGNVIPQQGISGLNAQTNKLPYLADRVYGMGEEQYGALAPYVTKALQAGFDPQNQLFNQLFNQQQQQNLASQAMAGVGQSPYAAGLTAQGNQNFDINWQNQQLARQAQGAQTAEGLSGAAMNAVNQGFGAETTAQQALSNALGQIAGIQNIPIQDYLAYLQGSSNNAYNAIASQLGALQAGTGIYNANNTSQNANQQFLNSGLSGLGKAAGDAAAFAFL